MWLGDLPVSEQAVEDYLIAWRNAHSSRRFDKTYAELSAVRQRLLDNELYDWMYRNLDSLDTKAASLLTACSILQAIDVFLIQAFLSKIPPEPIPLFIIVSALFALGAFGLCCLVIQVRWTSTVQLRSENFSEALRLFVRARNFRTRMYLIGWSAMMLSMVFIVLYLLNFVGGVGVTFR